MSQHTQLLLIKGAITELSEDQQKSISKAVGELNSVVGAYGDDGIIALSLVALQAAVDSED
jgi:hypothetical protein